MRQNLQYFLKKNFFSIVAGIFFSGNFLFSQTFSAGVDTLISVRFENSINIIGREQEYFPKNIFGLPDPAAAYNIASVDPKQICALGVSGEIVVGFKDAVLIDREGADFTIFENAFLNPINKKIFAEPAKVSVSRDGINFVEFPFDSLTLQGCAGVTPTNGKENPFDPVKSGGDAFDLQDIGIDSVRFIKISDVSPIVMNKNHPFYDITISGFDLDAVVGLHLEKIFSQQSKENFSVKYLSDGDIQIETEKNYSQMKFQVISSEGKIIKEENFENAEKLIRKKNFATGLYFILVRNESEIFFSQKVLF